jgi:hypothetical protein
VPLMEGRQISIKEQKVPILFKVIFILSRKFSCQLKFHDMISNMIINNIYDVEMTFKMS